MVWNSLDCPLFAQLPTVLQLILSILSSPRNYWELKLSLEANMKTYEEVRPLAHPISMSWLARKNILKWHVGALEYLFGQA